MRTGHRQMNKAMSQSVKRDNLSVKDYQVGFGDLEKSHVSNRT